MSNKTKKQKSNHNFNNLTYFKFLKIIEIIYLNSDEDNPIKSSKIEDIMEKEYNIKVNYRSISNIVKYFNKYFTKINIVKTRKKENEYYIEDISKIDFIDAKAIVDITSSSKFFPKSSKEKFIKLFKSLVQPTQESKLNKELNTHIYANENDQSYYQSYESICNAIYDCRKICFDYSKPQPDNQEYIKSYNELCPIETYYVNDTFYVYCYDEKEPDESKKTKSFRIDFIKNVRESESFKIDDHIKNEVKNKIIHSTYGYSATRFTNIEFTYHKSIHPNIVDKFGNIINPKKIDDKLYVVQIRNCPITDTLYGWIIGFGGKINITSPSKEVINFKNFLLKNFIKKT